MHPDPSDEQEYIGVDVGSVRVGLARGSGLARLAEPVKVVPAADALKAIKDLVSINNTDAIVVGLPRNLNGKDTQQTQSVRAWVKQIMPQLDLPFYWQDEALTTQTATESGSGNDAQAASVILQDFLDTPKEERVRC